MRWWSVYLAVSGVAAITALCVTPIFRALARRLDFMDRPAAQAHKGHAKCTPLLGGAAICLAWLVTIGLGLLAARILPAWGWITANTITDIAGLVSVKRQLLTIIGCSVAITVIGIIDDKRPMSAKVKFSAQFLIAAITATWGDARVSVFINSEWFSWCLTVLWIVTVINAINFFDNMDGLAVGVSAIAFCFFTIAAAVYGHYFVACLSSAAAGAAIGFWFFNHSPASIFMGDSGSHFLGYNLAVAGALTTFYREGESASRLSVLVPIFILAVPLFDAFAVTVIRTWNRKPFYVGDHNHISHRFCRMGMDRKEAVFAVHLISLTIGMGVLPLLWGDPRTCAVCFVQACTFLLLFCMLKYSARKDKT